MYSLVALAALASSAVTGVAAHGGVIGYTIGGQYFPGWRPYDNPSGQTSIQRPWSSHNPIESPTASTLACNNNGQPGPLQLTATVQAGQSVVQYWNHVWPHAQGPVLTYLAKCPGSTCDGVNSNSLKWFKIQEAGLLSGTVGKGFWAAEKMQNDNSTWTTVIPASVPSGAYLLRSETIAIHSVPSQFYPECAQIQITGGGSREPTAAELVSFPGGYSASEPGVNLDINTQQAMQQSSYVIPGPPLYGGAGGSTSYPPTQPPTTQPPTTQPPTTQPPTTQPPTQPPTTNPPTQTGTVAQYGQCGGNDYNGPTACQSPYTCQKLNDWYSQCL